VNGTGPGSSMARRDALAPQVLLLGVTLLLVAFYYLARADTIGVHAATRGWHALTAGPLSPAWHFAGSAVLLAGLPLLLARALGFRWRDLGLGLGDRRRGLVVLAAGAPLAILGGYIGSLNPELRAVYPLDASLTAAPAFFLADAARELLYFGAWEVLFRGVLLFGLRSRVGAGLSNVTQTSLSVVAHFGRAVNETFAAIPGGLIFGWLALWTGSIWYVALLHWLLGVSLNWFILTS